MLHVDNLTYSGNLANLAGLAPERLSFVRVYWRIRESCEARSTCSIRRRVVRGPLQAGPPDVRKTDMEEPLVFWRSLIGQSRAFPARGRPLTRHRPGAARGRFRWGVQPRGVRASKRCAGLEDNPRRFREAGVPHPPSSGPTRPRLPLLCGPDRRREARLGASLRLRGRSARDRGWYPKTSAGGTRSGPTNLGRALSVAGTSSVRQSSNRALRTPTGAHSTTLRYFYGTSRLGLPPGNLLYIWG